MSTTLTMEMQFDVIHLCSETVTGFSVWNNNNNSDRLTAFDPGQPG